MRRILSAALVLVGAGLAAGADEPKRDPVRDVIRQDAERVDQQLKEYERDADGPRNYKLPKYLKAGVLKAAAEDDELRRLQKERYNTAVLVLKVRYLRMLDGRVTVEAVYESARKVADAEADLTEKPADRVAAREKLVELAKDVERVYLARYEAGRLSLDELAGARELRLDAEIELVREKRKATAAGPPK
jgi:hypothetical protein